MILYFIIFMLLVTACTSDSESLENIAVTNIHETSIKDYDFWVSIEEAQERAKEEEKYILLDFYTEWCGYCRRMNQETYADEQVQNIIDRYFYVVRMDAESEKEIVFEGETYTMRELAFQFGVSSYPTTIFISPDGEPIAAQPGFIEASQFHTMLAYVGSESYQHTTFQQFNKTH